MALKEKLLEFGLNEKEAAFYLTSLELGKANLSQIAEKAKLNRTTCYVVISTLREKSLIKAQVIKNKKYFIAAEPEDLQRLIDQKANLLKSILPQLSALNNEYKKKPKVTFYEGEAGLVNIYLDNLTTKGELLTIAGEQVFNSLILNKVPNYIEQRIQNRVLLRLIAPDTKVMKEWQVKDREQLRITKLIPSEKFNPKINIDIYNNKVALTSFEEKVGLIIESKDISDTMKVVFGLWWESLS